MKMLPWLLAGFVVACTPKPNCSVSNCLGCCDAKGQCQLGSTDNTCGLRGSLCVACSSNQACQTGLCTLVYDPKCNVDTCGAGCCNGSNCSSGNQDTSCGRGGGVCATCGSTQHCVNGVCEGTTDGGTDGGSCGPGNCSGCCLSGVCTGVLQQNDLKCGSNGVACVGCGTGNSCISGDCTGTSACSGANCPAGCCYGTGASAQCLSGADNTYCGNGGDTCASCTGIQTCQGQACLDPPTCGSCPSGCCQGASCLAGTANTNCGNLGANCQACNVAGGQTCVAQACTGALTKTVGDTCSSSAQCAALGTGYTCKLATNPGAFGYPLGYCTKLCTADTDCPTGTSFCAAVDPAFGEEDSLCWKSCPVGNECRTSGYKCWAITSKGGVASNGCWLNPLPPYDAGPQADKIGANCTDDGLCQNPPDNGFCFTDTFSDGGFSGWTSGYCSAECVTVDHCGPNGVCLSFTTSTTPIDLCMKLCPAPGTVSTCGTGYVCDNYTNGLPDGGSVVASDGYCWPHCNYKPCSTGTTCQPSGLCQ